MPTKVLLIRQLLQGIATKICINYRYVFVLEKVKGNSEEKNQAYPLIKHDINTIHKASTKKYQI